MTKDKALTLALEALENLKEVVIAAQVLGIKAGATGKNMRLGESFLHDKAIIAIKAALAQPEQEIDWKDMYDKEKRRSAMWLAKYEAVAGPAPKAYPQAQPEQEPVAWMCNAVDGDVCERSNHDDCEDPIPLYTTPPKRQPLTDDEINKCDMCGYVGKDKDSIGQCPKCRWDELRPLVEKARQKPLTDDQIYDMYNEPRSDAEMLEFARAIEAAHGIKEKNT